VLTGLLFVGIVGAGASVVVRFRRSRGIERQQMKWLVYAVVPMLFIPTEDYLPGIIGLPTAIGIAVLRYRFYEIDLVINRTLIYGPLTATLVFVYLGGVISLQYAFRVLTGQESSLAVVASTLVIAALFNPLRRRVQGFVDRRFYRRKYDARKTLEVFSTRLHDETDLYALSGGLVGVVRETMQPAHVSLWLRPETAPKDEQAEWQDASHKSVGLLPILLLSLGALWPYSRRPWQGNVSKVLVGVYSIRKRRCGLAKRS
jgi:hypothetical protein